MHKQTSSVKQLSTSKKNLNRKSLLNGLQDRWSGRMGPVTVHFNLYMGPVHLNLSSMVHIDVCISRCLYVRMHAHACAIRRATA